MGYERAILSGDVMEYYHYKNPKCMMPWEIAARREIGEKKKRKVVPLEEKIEKRVENMGATKKKVRRLIDCNKTPDDVFLTLTFGENVQDISGANYEFKKFRQRMEYRLGKKLRYVVVIEFQERGAVHYHAYLFGVGFVDWQEYERAWGHGFIRVNHIDRPAGAGVYVTAYMTKDIATDARLMGRKCYFSSRGLVKPRMVDEDQAEFQDVKENLGLLDVTQAEGGCACELNSSHVGEYFYARGTVYND